MSLNLVIDCHWLDEMRWRWGTSEGPQNTQLRGIGPRHDMVLGEACHALQSFDSKEH